MFQGGDTIDITWDSYGFDIDYVSIWLASSYDTAEWILIEQYAPNTGIYEWIAPDDSLHARINLQAYNAIHQLEAADGSYYAFTMLPTGIEEHEYQYDLNSNMLCPTVFTNLLQLPKGKSFKIFDITGRQIHSLNPTPGIYFIEVDGEIVHKIIKIK